jgi:hypothetical protein
MNIRFVFVALLLLVGDAFVVNDLPQSVRVGCTAAASGAQKDDCDGNDCFGQPSAC